MMNARTAPWSSHPCPSKKEKYNLSLEAKRTESSADSCGRNPHGSQCLVFTVLLHYIYVLTANAQRGMQTVAWAGQAGTTGNHIATFL
jgi:hypothetical protein